MTTQRDATEILAGLAAGTRAYVASALRYWEPRRIFYNLVLAAVLVAHIAAGGPRAQARITFDLTLAGFLLAVLANLCYCAVYAADAFLQLSGIEEALRVGRALLLGMGTAFAATLTHFVAKATFGV